MRSSPPTQSSAGRHGEAARERVRRRFRRQIVWEAWTRAIRETVEAVEAGGLEERARK
ncbi:MAG TPA: hypothetical protein VLF66_03150 [Thermoanaerobaculia bacterium]|nr:hypothetical protein [Thermoanaerobaculia bacterium]